MTTKSKIDECGVFTEAVDYTGETRTLRIVEGQILVCKGCCCGNTDRGNPEVPLDRFKSEWKQREIRKRIHLTLSGCLGPCAVPNVVMFIYDGQTAWFHSINSESDVVEMYDYVDGVLDAGAFFLPTGALGRKLFQRFREDAFSARHAGGPMPVSPATPRE